MPHRFDGEEVALDILDGVEKGVVGVLGGNGETVVMEEEAEGAVRDSD